MKATGVKPLKPTKRQSGSLQKRGMAAFIPITEGWKEKVRTEGHGGDWAAHRYKGNGPTIFATMSYDKKHQVFTKIGHMEAMQRAAEGKDLYILPFNEEVILSNPANEGDFEDALKTTDAVEKFEYQQLTSSLYPDLSKIDQARRMQESGTFRTMAEITSGTKAPSARPIKVRGMTDKKMRAQVLGLQPTPLETLSSTESKRLRKRLQEYIYKQYETMASTMLEKGQITEGEFDAKLKELGADEVALMDALLMGHEKYIDRTQSTINDFNRLIMAYHKMRATNTPFLYEITPSLLDGLSQTEGLFKGFEQKFLDAISPTAPNLLQTHTIHLIYDIEGEEVEPKGLHRFIKLVYGEVTPESFIDPAFVSGEIAKSVNRFLAAHRHDGTSAAKAVIQASMAAFLSKKGVADVGLEISVDPRDYGLMSRARTIAQSVADALDTANNARVEHKPFEKLFAIENEDGEQADKETRRKVMQELVRRGLAFPIDAPAYLPNPPEPREDDRDSEATIAKSVAEKWEVAAWKAEESVRRALEKKISIQEKELAAQKKKFSDKETKLKAKVKAEKEALKQKRRVLSVRKNARITDLVERHRKLVTTTNKQDANLKKRQEAHKKTSNQAKAFAVDRKELRADLTAAKEKHKKAVEDAKGQELKALEKEKKKTEEASDKLLNLQQKHNKETAEIRAEKVKLKAEADFFSSGTTAGDGFYLIPLFSSGFQKNPKGWNGKWVVPTMQVLDEYAEVMADAKQNISALNLLFLIAARAKALYDYELKESETMLIYSMLDPHDPDAAVVEDLDDLEMKLGGGEVGRAGLLNPPANILPYGVKPSDLAQPFDSTKAEYIFKRLTKEIKDARTGDSDRTMTRWKDATGGVKKIADQDKIEDLAKQVAIAKTSEPSKVAASDSFQAAALRKAVERQSLTYPKGKHDEVAKAAFMMLVKAYNTDRGTTTSRSATSRPGAFRASNLEHAIKLLDFPGAAGGQIMTKKGKYLIVMPEQQSQHLQSGWEPVAYPLQGGYAMPPEQAKGLARAKANPSPDYHPLAPGTGGFVVGERVRYNGGHTGHYMSKHESGFPPANGLTKGQVFTIKEIDMQDWMTWLSFEETPNQRLQFNSTAFDRGSELGWLLDFDSFAEELAHRQKQTGFDFSDLLKAMAGWDIKNGKALLEEYEGRFNPSYAQIPYEWAIWAKPRLPRITRDYGLRAIWNGLIQKYQPTPGGLIERAKEGTHTMPGSSKYRKNPKRRYGPDLDEGCSWRKSKRSKACGGRVSIMKNGRLYKCASCGAKYEMR
jgi:hypothetical protein